MVLRKHSPPAIHIRRGSLLVGLVFGGILNPSIGLAQDHSPAISVSARVDQDRITIGDLVQLTVTASSADDASVRMPDAGTDLGDFDLRDYRLDPPTEDGQGRKVWQVNYTLSTFKVGEMKIPAIAVDYSVPGQSDSRQVLTSPILITVDSVLGEDPQDIQDIKSPQEIPRDWFPILMGFGMGALLAAVVLVLILRHRKRRTTAAGLIQNELPARPPHLTAREALDRLRESHLIETGEVTRYYVELSEIIRRYLEQRYRVEALEMTTRELLLSLSAEGMLQQPLDLVKSFLRRCDLVKFAKFEPTRLQSDEVLESAYHIVDLTSLEPAEESNVEVTQAPSVQPEPFRQGAGQQAPLKAERLAGGRTE